MIEKYILKYLYCDGLPERHRHFNRITQGFAGIAVGANINSLDSNAFVSLNIDE